MIHGGRKKNIKLSAGMNRLFSMTGLLKAGSLRMLLAGAPEFQPFTECLRAFGRRVEVVLVAPAGTTNERLDLEMRRKRAVQRRTVEARGQLPWRRACATSHGPPPLPPRCRQCGGGGPKPRRSQARTRRSGCHGPRQRGPGQRTATTLSTPTSTRRGRTTPRRPRTHARRRRTRSVVAEGGALGVPSRCDCSPPSLCVLPVCMHSATNTSAGIAASARTETRTARWCRCACTEICQRRPS